jgi:two-component system cell cycle sensor histidine kinase/response regulator CckA
MHCHAIHVLLLEDAPGDARLAREMGLDAPELSVHSVDSLAAAIAHLTSEHVDVVLLDLELSDSQGLDNLQSILKVAGSAPVVVLTGQDDETLGRSALSEGAQDYLVKGHLAGHDLTRAVRYIVECKRAEEHLAETTERLNLAQSSANVGLWDWDVVAGHIEWSPHMYSLFGLDPNGATASFESWSSALHPDDRDIAEQRIDLALRDQSALDSDYRIVLPDGQVRWVNAAGKGHYDSQGRPVRMMGVCADISARKHAEEALKEVEAAKSGLLERLNEAQQVAAIGSWEWNLLTDEVWWSDETYRIFGAEQQDYVPTFETNGEFIHPDDRATYGEAFEYALKTGEPLNLDLRIVAGDGQLKHCSANGEVRLDESGRPIRFIGTIMDITERKRAEAQRESLEEQLRASQKMEAIGGLAGGVAHDFNNMLSVILGYTGFALEGLQDGDPVKDSLLQVEKAGERAAMLTRQLLAFSSKQVLQPVALSLNQSVAGIEQILRRVLGEDIDLAMTLAPDLGLTLADPGQIEQVIMNLATNARDAMPAGGRLTIETSNVEDEGQHPTVDVLLEPGSYVQLSVTDTGCGMDEQTRMRIFEPFFTTKEKGKGTGLGLSTVYGIVRQCGGDIRVYSELGQGTTFKICLPRDLSSSPTTDIESSAAPMQLTGTETILVVEDEEALRMVAKRSLEEAGYRVLTASDGEEAMLVSAQHPGEIHLLLTDAVMPRMSGKMVAKNLLETRPELKVLCMSGYAEDVVAHQGVLEAGIYFLSKPFTSATLARKVRRVLEG